MTEKKDRYQNQTFLVKLFRRRHQIRVPYDTIKFYFEQERDGKEFTFCQCFDVAVGWSHIKMKWVYTWETDGSFS